MTDERATSTILLVEDNHAHAELVKRCISSQEIPTHVVHVTNGQAALDYLFKREEFADLEDALPPDLVLLDLRLPRLGGLEVLQEIRSAKDLPQIPVIVLTSSKADDDVRDAYRHRANSYLVKPFGYPEFSALIDQVLNYWLTLNQRPVG